MKQLRFIETEYNYADFSTSVSPAVELSMEQRQAQSTVLFNIFQGDSFTVGFLDDPEKCLDLDYCKKEEIVVRRRQNAGGAVWGPAGGALIVLNVDTKLPWVPMKTVKDAFAITLNNLAEVMQELFHVNAVYRPINDVEIEGRKLIPTSARLEKNVLTMRLLVNVVPTNQEILRKAIKSPIEKIKDKRIQDAGARFTCLEKETGRKVTVSDLKAVAGKTIQKIFGEDVELVSGELTQLEKKYAAKYQKQYTSDDWFYANSEQMRFKTEGLHKAPAGLIRVTLLIRQNRIDDLIITGDFHPSPYHVLRDMEDVLRGKEIDIEVIQRKIQQTFNRPDVEIAGVEATDFIQAFTKAFNQIEKKI
jgi:lipoate-protein ligase A